MVHHDHTAVSVKTSVSRMSPIGSLVKRADMMYDNYVSIMKGERSKSNFLLKLG